MTAALQTIGISEAQGNMILTSSKEYLTGSKVLRKQQGIIHESLIAGESYRGRRRGKDIAQGYGQILALTKFNYIADNSSTIE